MDDPIYRAPELVVSDGERLQVLGPLPGPAGVSALATADHGTWQVDHVNLEDFEQLEVPASDAASSPLLAAAFGGDATLFALESTLLLSGDDPAWSQIDHRRPRWSRPRWRGRPFGPNPSGEAGGLVLLADLAVDRRVHPLARIVAALEATARVDANPARALIDPLVANLLEGAGTLVDDFDDDEIEVLDPATLREVEGLLHRARSAHRSPQIPVSLWSRLADRVERVARSGRATDDAEPIAALAFAAPPEDAAIDLRAGVAESRRPEPEAPILERTGDALVEVTVTRSDTPRWARVLRHGSFVLLGEAPMRRRGLVDVAEVVVPTDATDGEMHAQVLHEADLGRLERGSLDAIRAAISAGRDAARADRLAEGELARLRWERCAELWAEAGDADRAHQAGELAETTAGAWVADPTVTDRVVEAVAPLA